MPRFNKTQYTIYTSSVAERIELIDTLHKLGYYWHGNDRYTGVNVEHEYSWHYYPYIVFKPDTRNIIGKMETSRGYGKLTALQIERILKGE